MKYEIIVQLIKGQQHFELKSGILQISEMVDKFGLLL